MNTLEHEGVQYVEVSQPSNQSCTGCAFDVPFEVEGTCGCLLSDEGHHAYCGNSEPWPCDKGDFQAIWVKKVD